MRHPPYGWSYSDRLFHGDYKAALAHRWVIVRILKGYIPFQRHRGPWSLTKSKPYTSQNNTRTCAGGPTQMFYAYASDPRHPAANRPLDSAAMHLFELMHCHVIPFSATTQMCETIFKGLYPWKYSKGFLQTKSCRALLSHVLLYFSSKPCWRLPAPLWFTRWSCHSCDLIDHLYIRAGCL